jgi:hypothetical protein
MIKGMVSLNMWMNEAINAIAVKLEKTIVG